MPRGKIGHVVVGIFAAAKGLLALVEHADNCVEAGLDGDFFADGELIAEELLPGVVAEDDDVCAAMVFVVGVEAAFAKDEVGDEGDLRGGALQDGSGDLLAFGI